MEAITRGAKVIVRTAGGFPRVRRLWKAVDTGIIVAEEPAYRRLRAGYSPMAAGAVSVPADDVFVFDPGVRLDPGSVFRNWSSLRQV